MNVTNNIVIASITKPCPFCAGRGILTQAADRPVFGIQCTGCPSSFGHVFDTPDLAVAAWCLRRGTVSAAGGRASKGKLSWRKGRSCRRNLRRAREQKKLKWIGSRIDAMYRWLKEYRAKEIAESEAAFTASMAELGVLEPRIRRYPDLSAMFDDLRLRQAQAKARESVPENLHRPQQ